jgi:hypothetical protein
MKLKYTFWIPILFSLTTYGQNVGIGTSSPNAALDISATNNGILIPRVALTGTGSASPLTSPATSTMVYNTATVSNVTPGYYYWSGTAWIRLIDNASIGGATTVSNTSSANTVSTTVNGVTGATVPMVNSISNTSGTNTLSTTVNGVTGTGVNIINSNALGLTGNNLTATINGIGSAAQSLSGLSLSGDVTGTLAGSTVGKIQGTLVTISSLSNGNLLQYNSAGTAWVNVAPGSALFTAGTGLSWSGSTLNSTGVTSIIAGSGVSISGGTGAVTITNSAQPAANTITGSGTTNYVAKFTGANTIGNSQIYDNGTLVGIGGTGQTAVKLSVVAASNGFSAAFSGGNAAGIYPALNQGFSHSENFSNGMAEEDVWNTLNPVSFPSTGFRFLQLLTASSARDIMFLSNTGYVGIGTTAPAVLMDLKGNNVGYGGQLRLAATDYDQITFYNSANLTLNGTNRLADMYYDIVGSELYIDNQTGTNKYLALNQSGGNVGIGTASPAFALDVVNNGYNAIRASGNSANSVGIFVTNTVASGRQWAMISSGGGPSPVGTFTIWDDNAGAPRMNINSSGYVGIGTTTPGVLMDLKGNNVPYGGQLRLAATDYDQITFYNSSNLTLNGTGRLADMYYDVAGTELYIENQTGTNKYLALNQGGGNVGIGTATPATTLEVNGSVRVDNLAGSGYSAVYTDASGNLVRASSLVLTSTTQADAANLPSGTYTFNFPGSSGPQQLYYQNNFAGGIGYVLVFQSPYNGTATVNMVGLSIPFTKFLIQTDGVNGTLTRATAFFSASRLFNSSSSTTAASGGDHAGYYVFIGSGGGMGIYNTSQLPCNWSNSVGSVGAGYYSSGGCGSYPNGLLWGTGNSGIPQYNAITMNWQIWIAS